MSKPDIGSLVVTADPETIATLDSRHRLIWEATRRMRKTEGIWLITPVVHVATDNIRRLLLREMRALVTGGSRWT